jgi:hypothetical protein
MKKQMAQLKLSADVLNPVTGAGECLPIFPAGQFSQGMKISYNPVHSTQTKLR